MKLSLYEVAQVVGAKNDVRLFADVDFKKAEFDSRLIGEGDLFLPLKGARDGHDFIEVAFEQGAAATLSERPLDHHPYIWVEDVLAALQDLARYYLDKMGVEVFAVTGSNGKTTTKDMLAHLLAQKFPTYKTQGNYNNEIGLPYTVLHMPADTEKLVLEMGQDHLGDIEFLSLLARPSVGIVTLVGEAHLEFFKNRSEIARGKLQIAAGMPDKALLLVPKDDIVEEFLPSRQRLVRFGQGAELEVEDLVEAKESLRFRSSDMEQEVFLPVTGKYNATNAMLAAYVAKRAGLSEEEIVAAFKDLTLTRNRTEWKKAANGADLLSDVYNANPTAMRLILETFSTIPKNDKGRKLVLLADMKELGAESRQLHAAMLDSLSPELLDQVFLYGVDMEALYEVAASKFGPDQLHYFVKNESRDDFDQLLAAVKKTLKPADQLLLKGSNSMNLASLVESLEEEV